MDEQGSSRDTYIALGMLGAIAVMVLPLSPFVLDVLLGLSLATSVVIFFVTINVQKPLEFSTFPTILLVSTLFRLALNVATTRLILTHGSEGEAAAGRVVAAFAHLVLGGNYVIGLVTFVILIAINFLVITKGAGRIAEVSARFTLDALPGKQMSIDAELAAGHINDKEARAKRHALERETDFYGAMDGASKFVRGDAVAAILITVVNIVGGFAVGVLQQGLDVGRAAEVYTVLSVGDGLVSQLPALLVSSAAGILSTRSASGAGLASTLSVEMLQQERPLRLGAFVLGAIGLMPGMPHVAYLSLAALLATAARQAKAGAEQRAHMASQPEPTKALLPPKNEIEDALTLGLLDLEVGFDLVPLVDQAKGGELLKKIQGLRKQLAQELGIVVPAINVRDNLLLKPSEYRLLLSGNEIGKAEVRSTMLLAMSGSSRPLELPGEVTKEPAFGLEAKWIAMSDRHQAERLGYTTVDAPTVMTTHLSELLRQYSADLLGRREAQQLFDIFAAQHPKVLDELVPNQMSAVEVVKVLRLLLREGQSIRDLRTIVEALLEHASQVKDTEQLTELVRQRMSRHISGRFVGQDGQIHGLFLDPQAEDVFRQLQRGTAVSDPQALSRIMKSLESAMQGFAASSHAPVIVTAPDVRRSVYTLVARYFPGLAVISLRELDQRLSVVSVGVVSA